MFEENNNNTNCPCEPKDEKVVDNLGERLGDDVLSKYKKFKKKTFYQPKDKAKENKSGRLRTP
ncbi:MAG: hypothetical protein IJ837_02450 [Clostridia bacterium]|nr:hypothetical protein [Clostridia bacterium]